MSEAHKDDMQLPAGRTCGDCASFRTCKGLFGCKPSNTRCDWSPSRFMIKIGVEQASVEVPVARAASPQVPADDGAEAEGYAFRSDGKLWVVTDPVVAMKWQEQGFEVTPVTAASMPILSGLTIYNLFLKWSEYTSELGEAISQKNIEGFVTDLRAMLAASPAAESKTLPRESEGATPPASEFSPGQ